MYMYTSVALLLRFVIVRYVITLGLWSKYCYRNRERLRCNGVLIISKA